MKWPWQGGSKDAADTIEVALFPLGTPLLPGGRLSLKIFEARYLDLMTDCLRHGKPFGICLIEKGSEVAAPGTEPAVPHAVGTLATVEALDMREAGIMQVGVFGGRRFRIATRRVGANGLQQGVVSLLDDAAVAVPERFAKLLPLLQTVLADLGEARAPKPHRFDDAVWVGHRFVDVLPVQPLAKQKLLELDDPLSRLEIIEKYLQQRGLVN
jgi:hypothetical protein